MNGTAEGVRSFGRMSYQIHQCCPRHDAFHLCEEVPLARSLGRQVQAQIGLFHGSDCKHVARQVMQTIPKIN